MLGVTLMLLAGSYNGAMVSHYADHVIVDSNVSAPTYSLGAGYIEPSSASILDYYPTERVERTPQMEAEAKATLEQWRRERHATMCENSKRLTYPLPECQ